MAWREKEHCINVFVFHFHPPPTEKLNGLFLSGTLYAEEKACIARWLEQGLMKSSSDSWAASQGWASCSL